MLSKKNICLNFKKLSMYSNNFLNDNNNKYIKRNKKTNLVDGFIFKLLYTQKNHTQDNVTDKINKFKNTFIDRTCFRERSNLIDETLLSSYYNHINTHINNLFYKDREIKIETIIIALDGSKGAGYASVDDKPIKNNKNNDTFNFLNIRFFNITYNEPMVLHTENHKNERKAALDAMEDIKEYLNPLIYVSDRGFYSKNYVDEICKNNNFFIVRIKENSTLINHNGEQDYLVNVAFEHLKTMRIVHYNIGVNKYYIQG